MATPEQLEDIYGVDLSFDGTFGQQDVEANPPESNFRYASDVEELSQELQRLFDLTPKGSLVEDPTYGIDWTMIGDALHDVQVTAELIRLEVLEALSHPSFEFRFQVADIEVEWRPDTPGAFYVTGFLNVFGFEQDVYRFGPYAMQVGR